jgi:hypothetical protein
MMRRPLGSRTPRSQSERMMRHCLANTTDGRNGLALSTMLGWSHNILRARLPTVGNRIPVGGTGGAAES